jgi:hypothetical protein
LASGVVKRNWDDDMVFNIQLFADEQVSLSGSEDDLQ